MAILVLPSHTYGVLLEQAVGLRSLKIRMAVERFKAKKNRDKQIRINLLPNDASEITGLLYANENFGQGEHQDAEGFARALDSFADDDHMYQPPLLAYHRSEWKAIVEMATKCDSTIDLNQKRDIPVMYPLDEKLVSIRDYLLDMIARANGVDSQRIEINPNSSHHDAEAIGATAFGVVDTQENEE